MTDIKTVDVPEGYALVSIEYLDSIGVYEKLREQCIVNLPSKFADRIRAMNQMYELPVLEVPGFVDTTEEMQEARHRKFMRTLQDEVDEGFEIEAEVTRPQVLPKLELLVMLADWFGDLTVFIRSEAMKYGIPLEEVLEIIMDSNESKLSADGKPIKDENGKFLKGPNYWKPEPKIRELLARKLQEAEDQKE